MLKLPEKVRAVSISEEDMSVNQAEEGESSKADLASKIQRTYPDDSSGGMRCSPSYLIAMTSLAACVQFFMSSSRVPPNFVREVLVCS